MPKNISISKIGDQIVRVSHSYKNNIGGRRDGKPAAQMVQADLETVERTGSRKERHAAQTELLKRGLISGYSRKVP